MKKLVMLLLLVLMMSCATGTKVMFGEKLKAIPLHEVTMMMSLPTDLVKGVDYVEVAMIKTQCSTYFLGEEAATEEAVEKLKEMAAEIGANTIIVQSFDNENKLNYNIWTGYSADSRQEVRAVALYVYKRK